MATLPIYVYAVFILTFIGIITLFSKSTRTPGLVVTLLMVWAGVQCVLGISGFYLQFSSTPPRFPILIIAPTITIILLFITAKGRHFIDDMNIKILSIMHTLRIPIELVLFWLALHKAIPQLMTFEGRNWDILSGFTAPLIYYWGFVKNKLNRQMLIGWNLICLGLVLNVMINGILSVPSPFQQFAFEQPNIAVLYFPFVLLPALIVPLVIFAHLVSLRKLLKV